MSNFVRAGPNAASVALLLGEELIIFQPSYLNSKDASKIHTGGGDLGGFLFVAPTPIAIGVPWNRISSI